MIEFLAQATAADIGAREVGAVGGAGLGVLIIKVLGDIIKEWWKGRTKLGKTLQNGSACQMTKEVQDVILEKDGDRRRVHFPESTVVGQHKELADSMQALAESQIRSAVIQEQILAELVRIRAQ